MNRIALTVVIACALMLGACASSWWPALLKPQDGDTSKLPSFTEKRDALVAVGYAVVSAQHHRNSAQQRLMAMRASKLDAYRALAEQVYGEQLDANSSVADMTVMSDTFRARVEGVILGAELVSITPVGDDTYETTLSLDRQMVNDLRALYVAHLASKRH